MIHDHHDHHDHHHHHDTIIITIITTDTDTETRGNTSRNVRGRWCVHAFSEEIAGSLRNGERDRGDFLELQTEHHPTRGGADSLEKRGRKWEALPEAAKT